MKSNRLNLAESLQAEAATAVEEPGVTIRGKAKEKADADQAMVNEVLGIVTHESQQFYRNGTKMLACGEETFKGFRKQYDDMPMFSESLEKAIAGVKKEKREDFTAALCSTHIDQRGVLQGANGGLVLTGNSMQNLASFAPDMEPGLKYNVNAWLSSSPKICKFRTRNPSKVTDMRALYAVVSEKYSKFDLDDACASLREKFPVDCHGTVEYDGSRWAISAELAPEHKVQEIGVGAVFRIRVKITGADDRSKGLKAVIQAERVRCINCTTITDERFVFQRRHIGEIADLFAEAMAHTGEAFEVFSQAWMEANKQGIIDKGTEKGLPAEEIFRRLIAHDYLKISGFTGPGKKDGSTGAPKLVKMLMDSFNKEPNLTAAGINNAITRLAHEQVSEWGSTWMVEEIEEAAGNLLFQQVYQLPSMTDKQALMFQPQASA